MHKAVKGISLAGLNVVMLTESHINRDARIQKEACSLANAGANTTVVACDKEYPVELSRNAPYKIILPEVLLPPNPPPLPRLGQQDVWLPLRCAINKTFTRLREDRYKKELAQYHGRNALHESDPVLITINASGIDAETSYYIGMIDAVKGCKVDVVHAHDLGTLYTGYRLAQMTGALLLYDTHELFLEMHTISDEAKSVLSIVEETIFPKLNALISVSPFIVERLMNQYEHSGIKPVVLYNGGSKIASSLSDTTQPIKLFFQGAFSPSRNLEGLIESVQGLRGLVTLTLQGWGHDYEDKLRALIENLGIGDFVEIIPPCLPLETVDSAASYDLGIINSIALDDNFLTTLPNKLFDYMCAGLAIASTDLPSIKSIIDEEGCGITFEQGSVDVTAKALADLASNPKKVHEMKEASLRAAPKYAWPAQGEKLVSLYAELMQEIS